MRRSESQTEERKRGRERGKEEIFGSRVVIFAKVLKILMRDGLLLLGRLGGNEGSVGTGLGDGGGALLLVDGLEELVVLLLVSDLLGVTSGLLVDLLATAAESDGGDETLDLGGNSAITLSFLSGDGAADDELTDIVVLGQVEELANARGTLGTEALSDSLISDVGDLLLSLLNDNNVDDRHLRGDDASADRLSTTISLATVGVVTVGSVQKKANSVGSQDSLLHGKTLLIESSSDTEDVSLVLVSQEFSRDILTDALIVEGAVLALLIDFVHLSGTSGGVGDVDLFHYTKQITHSRVSLLSFKSLSIHANRKQKTSGLRPVFSLSSLPRLLSVPSWPFIFTTSFHSFCFTRFHTQIQTNERSYVSIPLFFTLQTCIFSPRLPLANFSPLPLAFHLLPLLIHEYRLLLAQDTPPRPTDHYYDSSLFVSSYSASFRPFYRH